MKLTQKCHDHSYDTLKEIDHDLLSTLDYTSELTRNKTAEIDEVDRLLQAPCVASLRVNCYSHKFVTSQVLSQIV